MAQGLKFLEETVDSYLDGDKEKCELKTRAVEEMETKVDEAERGAERNLCRGTYLPLFREDLLDLMELIDDVADEAERVADFLAVENPEIPSLCSLPFYPDAAPMFRDNLRSFSEGFLDKGGHFAFAKRLS